MNNPEENFYSFEEPLRQICRKYNPLRILEWGPGRSTEVMAAECPNAEITSIEHTEAWALKAQQRFRHNKRVHIHYVSRAGGNANNGKGYIGYPAFLFRQEICTASIFDLIFVDGRDRTDCLAMAYMLIKDSGVVLLHDCQRERYQTAIALFEYRQQLEPRTLLLKRKRPPISTLPADG